MHDEHGGCAGGIKLVEVQWLELDALVVIYAKPVVAINSQLLLDRRPEPWRLKVQQPLRYHDVERKSHIFSRTYMVRD